MRIRTKIFFRLMRMFPRRVQLEIALVCLTFLTLNCLPVKPLPTHRISIGTLRRLILAQIHKGG